MRQNQILLFTDFSKPIWGRPLGAYRVATYLRRKGYGVRVLDLITEFSQAEMTEYLDKNVTEDTQIIGFSTTFLFSFEVSELEKYKVRLKRTEVFREIASYCRQKYPKIKIVVGGSSALSLKDIDADMYYYGYAESDIDRVFDISSFPESSNIYTSLNKNFDLASLDTEYGQNDFVFENETLALELTRGCRFNCKFCSFPLNGRKANTYFKEEESLRNELLRNYELYGTTKYFFSDDTFNESVEKLKYFKSIFDALPFKIEYTAYLRLDLIYYFPEMIDLLKDMGLRSAFFGIESLNDKSAKAVGKGLGVEKTLDILARLKNIWGDSVYVTTSYIVGLPHDNPDTVKSWFQEVTSKSFYTDSINMQALYLLENDKASFRSVFDSNPEKYGYRILGKESNILNWETDQWSFASCRVLAKEMVKKFELSRDRKPVRYYGYINLRGYGFSHEECIRFDLKNPEHCNKIKSAVQNRIYKYKEHVLLR